MIVYESIKQLFVEDVVQDRIEENIDRKFYEKMGGQIVKTRKANVHNIDLEEIGLEYKI